MDLANTVRRFDNRADDYVRYRPSYPADAIDAILAGLGEPSQVVAADVGAGTGISARLLGDRGVRVVAVEPGHAMRAAAAQHPNVTWVAGRADATGLRSASIDLVLCAQAFHWFHNREALAEFARILKPHHRLALMWNRRSKVDPLTAGYRQAIIDVGGEVVSERMPFDASIVGDSGFFTRVERRAWPNEQRVTLGGLIGRARSASYVPKDGPNGDRLVELLRDLHARHADESGYVTLVYETEVYLASRIS